MRPILALLVAGALTGSLAGACADGPEGTVRASLADLAAAQDDYDGRRVETSGVVRRFGEAEGATRLHHVIEDGDHNRVAVTPDGLAVPHVGREVVVVGTFRFSELNGRRIEIERLERREVRPAPAPAGR